MMESGTDYSARLTGNPFLFFETKVVAELMLRGVGRQDISEQVQAENLFQYHSLKSVPKRVHAIWKRLTRLDPAILERLVRGSSPEGKVITLLAIAQSDRLFCEFLTEVAHPQPRRIQNKLTKGDIRRYFETKGEVSPAMASLRESSRIKLGQIYLNILLNVGILTKRAEGNLQRVILDDEFKRILSRSFPSELIGMIEGTA